MLSAEKHFKNSLKPLTNAENKCIIIRLKEEDTLLAVPKSVVYGTIFQGFMLSA